MCNSDGGCRAECTPCNGSLGLDRGSTIVFPRAPLPVPAVVPTGGPLPPGLAATVSLASTAATLESLMAAGGQSGPAPPGALTPDATLASVASAAAMPPPPPRLPQRHGGEAGAREDGAHVPSRSRSPSESSNPRFREGDGEPRRMRTHSAERPVAPSWGRECVRVRCTRFGESPPPPPPERALSARLQGKPGVRVLRLFFSLSLGHPRLTTRSPFSGPLPSHMTPAPCVTGGGDTVRPYSCGLACAPVRSHAGHVSGRVAVFD